MAGIGKREGKNQGDLEQGSQTFISSAKPIICDGRAEQIDESIHPEESDGEGVVSATPPDPVTTTPRAAPTLSKYSEAVRITLQELHNRQGLTSTPPKPAGHRVQSPAAVAGNH